MAWHVHVDLHVMLHLGFLKPIAQQIDEAAAMIKNDTNLANGFHGTHMNNSTPNTTQ